MTDVRVIFGTGGEDIAGNLYRCTLREILDEDLSGAEVLLSGGEKGFIAPPLLVDVSRDGTLDVVVCTVDGRLVAIGGATGEVIWTTGPEGEYDTYTMPAPGYFTGDDDVPDFFASFGRGPWPETDFTYHILVNGATGEIVFGDTLGTFQYASPLVADFTGDGEDDVLLAINTTIKEEVIGDVTTFYSTELHVFPRGRGPARQAFPTVLGSNLGSTPLLTDLDGDGELDIVTAYMSDAATFYSFKNLVVERREIGRDAGGISWGQYIGPGSRGIFQGRRDE